MLEIQLNFIDENCILFEMSIKSRLDLIGPANKHDGPFVVRPSIQIGEASSIRDEPTQGTNGNNHHLKTTMIK